MRVSGPMRYGNYQNEESPECQMNTNYSESTKFTDLYVKDFSKRRTILPKSLKSIDFSKKKPGNSLIIVNSLPKINEFRMS